MNKIKLLTGLIALSVFNLANAATTSSPMQVSATIEPKCLVYSQDMLFGNVQLGAGASSVSISSNFNVECTKDTAYSVSWDGGLNASGTSTERRLKHATLNEYVTYLLKVDTNEVPSHTPVVTGYGYGIGTATTKQITGTISASQIAPAGNYTDIVTMTVEY